MNIYNIGALSLLRVPLLVDDGKEIISYGIDNLYPQRIKGAYNRSPLVKSGINLIASFLEGDGFESPSDDKINKLFHTDNDILRLVSEDLALFNGFPLLVNFDGTGDKTEYFSIPFEWVRFEKPKNEGEIENVYVSNNWQTIGASGHQEAKKYPLILPGQDLDSIKAPDGAIMYFTGLRQEYPLSRMDAIFDTAQADAQVQTFEYSNINNGFLSATIFKKYGAFKSEKEKEQYKAQIAELIGAENANSVFIITMDEDLKDAQLFEQLPANNNDTLFDSTVRNITNRVLQHLSVPPGLMSVTSDGAVFTQQNLSDDVRLMNERTASDRNMLERIFKSLGINESKIKVKSIENGGENISDSGGAPPAQPTIGEPRSEED